MGQMAAITPDSTVFWQWGFVQINATIVFTWAVMAFMAIGSWLITRRLTSDAKMSRWQNLLEIIVDFVRTQIREIVREAPGPYLPFVGTLFLFIAVCNALTIVPGYEPPTASLSTDAALAICVFLAVPIYGMANQGVGGFLKHYVQPTPFMLPFQVIGEVTRTLALAVRLFGNAMSSSMIVAILLAITPLLSPLIMQLLGLLTGLIQAYIFAILATVYIASGVEAAQKQQKPEGSSGEERTDQPQKENNERPMEGRSNS